MLNVTVAHHVREHVLWVEFNDGAKGEVDLADALEGEIFAPLHDAKFFSLVKVDPEIRTVTWPNGADIAPEFLRALLRSRKRSRS